MFRPRKIALVIVWWRHVCGDAASAGSGVPVHRKQRLRRRQSGAVRASRTPLFRAMFRWPRPDQMLCGQLLCLDQQGADKHRWPDMVRRLQLQTVRRFAHGNRRYGGTRKRPIHRPPGNQHQLGWRIGVYRQDLSPEQCCQSDSVGSPSPWHLDALKQPSRKAAAVFKLFESSFRRGTPLPAV